MDNTKRYLIEFITKMTGDKLTISQLKSIEKETHKLTKGMDKASAGAGRWDKSLANVAKRALTVAPVWMLLRGAMMLVTSTTRDAIQANIAFQENMARIKTVVTASSSSVEEDMSKMRAAILSMATKSRLSLGELAGGMYFLRTAGLSTDEALGAFESTVNTAIGTTNTLKDTTRIVVGIYNTMGKSLGDNLTISEKFTKINDALTYTYATQEVQLQELGQSYLNLAPYLSGLDDSFIDIITTLGFLNTKMLKAGRAGLLTGRAILQLTQNTKQLAEIFGITFDPNQPVNFLETLGKINAKLGDSNKLTSQQSKAIQTVFATRAGVTIRILLDNYKEFTEVIEKARTSHEGFNETMKDIMMHTYTAQMSRLKNIIAVSANEFFSAAAGSGDFVQELKNMNDTLEQSVSQIRELGILIGYLSNIFVNTTSPIIDYVNKIKEISGIDISKISSPFDVPFALADVVGEKAGLKPSKLLGYDKYRKEQLKAMEEGNKKQQQAAAFQAFQNNEKEISMMLAKEEQENLRNQIALLKEAGATELEIAKYKIQQFNNSKLVREAEEEALEKLKLQNNLLEAQMKLRNEITNTYLKMQVEYLKNVGGTEEDVLELQRKQLEFRKKAQMVTPGRYDLERLQLASKYQEIEVKQAKDLIEHQLELLRIRGASNLEILKASQLLQQSAFGKQSETQLLNQQLELEKEITKQKLLQVGYSSDTQQLYKIAQKHGPRTAQEIAKALREGINLDDMGFGFPKDIFRRYFPQKYETLEMQKYFDTGKGKDIDIPEKITERELKHIQMQIPRVADIPPIPVKVSATVDVITDREQIAREVRTEISKYLKSSQGKKEVGQAALDAEE